MDKTTLAVLVALLTAATVTFSAEAKHQDDYILWKSRFGPEWKIEEDAYRRLIYLHNVEVMNKHNADPSQTYKMGVNQFSAYTDIEFVSMFLNPRSNPNINSNVEVEVVVVPNADIDWTTKGWVSPVKNQGNCGSCWAFSAVAVLESWALSKGQTVNLSEQQLVDCAGKRYGNYGCNGGFNYQGLAYVKDHGIAATSAYPYMAKTKKCKINGGSFKISSVLTAKGCTDLAAAIQERPIGVTADATNWNKYSSGIFSNCGNVLNHNIQLVGHTSTYYKIKNSWGASWGENGFIRLALGNTCGICDDKSPWVA